MGLMGVIMAPIRCALPSSACSVLWAADLGSWEWERFIGGNTCENVEGQEWAGQPQSNLQT